MNCLFRICTYLHIRKDRIQKQFNLPGIVDVFERKKRNNMLRILSEKKRHQFYKEMIGKELKVLFEAENDDGIIKGFSSNYVRVINKFTPFS